MILKISVTSADIATVKAMSKKDRENLKIAINSTRPRSIFENGGDKDDESIICPICGNGSGENHTPVVPSLAADGQTWLYYCHRCHEFSGDLIELIAIANKLDKKNNFAEILTIGAKLINYNLNCNTIAPKSHYKNLSAGVEEEQQKRQLAMIYADIQAAQNNLAAFLETQGGNFRGLTYETLEKFNCGYLPEWVSPKIRVEYETGKRKKLLPPSRRFIIPTANHYNAVLLPAERTEENKKWGKIHAGKKEIFGAEFLPTNSELLLIVEGEIDAMSIWQATQGKYDVVATGGAGGYGKAVKFLQDKFSTHKPKILILFDSDETGKTNAPKLRDEFLNIGFPAVCKFLSADISKIDANEILQNEGNEKLAEIIFSIVADAQEEFSAAELNAKQRLENSAQNDSLQAELSAVKRKLADFDAEKNAAVEKIKSAVSFDKDFCFSEEILTAAAFAKLFDGKAFSDFKAGIQNQNTKNSFLLEWRATVKDKAAELAERHGELLARQKSINAQIVSANFFSAHSELQNFILPAGYEISKNGIEKIVADKSVTVARVPTIISAKIKNHDSETFKYVLAYLTSSGKWRDLPAFGAEIIFNARKLIDLAAYGLPVTSSNANLFVDFLDAFLAANEEKLPLSLNVSRCGWLTFDNQDNFVDPRRNVTVTCEDKIARVVAENSDFTRSLKSVGSLDEWKRAYDIAKKSPIIRFIVAASVAPPLLKILGERNFVLYPYGPTRSGKSTGLLLGASTVGNPDMVASFDATNNGLLARVFETTDFPFFVDEKQSADKNLKAGFQRFIYSVANGKERARAKKDGSAKAVRECRNILICNGETPLLDDNATGGAFTRLLQIAAPEKLLAADYCREIRKIISKSYGLVFPLVIDEIINVGFTDLNIYYKAFIAELAEKVPNVLSEYHNYVSVVGLADILLNRVLGGENDVENMESALRNVIEVLAYVPTLKEIDDAEREKNFVTGFIAQNQRYFLNATNAEIDQLPFVYGKFDDDFAYITVTALKQACKQADFDYQKLVADLVEDKFFVPDDKIPKGRKHFIPSVPTRIGKVSQRCFRIPRNLID